MAPRSLSRVGVPAAEVAGHVGVRGENDRGPNSLLFAIEVGMGKVRALGTEVIVDHEQFYFRRRSVRRRERHRVEREANAQSTVS